MSLHHFFLPNDVMTDTYGIWKKKQSIDILDDWKKEVIAPTVWTWFKDKENSVAAKKLGISQRYVSLIEKRALMKMFHEFYRAEKKKFKL